MDYDEEVIDGLGIIRSHLSVSENRLVAQARKSIVTPSYRQIFDSNYLYGILNSVRKTNVQTFAYSNFTSGEQMGERRLSVGSSTKEKQDYLLTCPCFLIRLSLRGLHNGLALQHVCIRHPFSTAMVCYSPYG